MALKKAVRLELLILTETGLEDEEILSWVKRACLSFCDFDDAIVRITEKQERLFVNEEAEATA
jgi:hypothetical protein